MTNQKKNLPRTKQDDFIYDIHEYGIDYNHNNLFLFGEDSLSNMNELEEPGVEYSMANKFIRNLHILSQKTSESITIHMKTCGGSWHEGMAIYDAIKLCSNKITILSYTHARSMSSIILQAADRRILMPHSTVMLHRGTIIDGGTVTQFNTAYEQNEISTNQMLEIYIDSIKSNGVGFKNKTRAWIKTWLNDKMDKKEDVYFSPAEAIKTGLADEIYTGENL